MVTLRLTCLGLLLCNLPETGYSAPIMVQQKLNLNGNTVSIDSYNSSDPTKSVNGQWAPSVSGDAGDVICLGGITNSVSIGNALVFGRVYVGSGTTVNLGPIGTVGTHAWIDVGNTGIEPGYLVSNANFYFPYVTLPANYLEFLVPTTGVVVVTNSGVPVTSNYDAVIGGGNYVSTSGLGNTIVTHQSTLVLPNGYSIGNLTILPGASLTVYVGGASSVSISANNILNQSGLPANLVVCCTSDITTIAFSMNAGFCGVLVAPNASMVISGVGNNPVGFSGAVMLKALTVNGHINVHFDEALIQQGIIPPAPSLVASLISPTMSESSQFQFNVSGVPGFSYTVETSTDLTDWLPVFTNTSPFTFTDTNATPPAQNFYRAVYYQQ